MNTLTPEMTGLLGAVIGSVIGFAGGLLGTWMVFRNVPGGVQSRFLKKAAVFCWIGALAFTATTLLVPGTWKWLLWSAYGPLLAWFIRYVKHTQAALQTAPSVDDPTA